MVLICVFMTELTFTNIDHPPWSFESNCNNSPPYVGYKYVNAMRYIATYLAPHFMNFILWNWINIKVMKIWNYCPLKCAIYKIATGMTCWRWSKIKSLTNHLKYSTSAPVYKTCAGPFPLFTISPITQGTGRDEIITQWVSGTHVLLYCNTFTRCV